MCASALKSLLVKTVRLMSMNAQMGMDHVKMAAHALTHLAAMYVHVHQSSLDRIARTMSMSAWQLLIHVRMVEHA